jgi:hypothetical protein
MIQMAILNHWTDVKLEHRFRDLLIAWPSPSRMMRREIRVLVRLQGVVRGDQSECMEAELERFHVRHNSMAQRDRAPLAKPSELTTATEAGPAIGC